SAAFRWWCVARKPLVIRTSLPVRKRQRTGALQKLLPIRTRHELAKRLGVRLCSAAFKLHWTPPRISPTLPPMPEPRTPWPHAPTHQLSVRSTYFVTAGTYLKAHHFRGADRLRVLHRGLLTVARDFGWAFDAWAVFSNHYHFVAHSPSDAPDASNLPDMLSVLHVKTAEW